MPKVFPIKEHLIPFLTMPSVCSCCLEATSDEPGSMQIVAALPPTDSSQREVSLNFPLCRSCQDHLIITERWRAASGQKEMRLWPLFTAGIIASMWLGFNNASWTTYLGLIVLLALVFVPLQIRQARARPKIDEPGHAPGHLRPVDLVRDPLTRKITLQIASDEYAKSFEQLNADLLAGGPSGRAAVDLSEHILLEGIRVCWMVGGMYTDVLSRGTSVPAEGVTVLQTPFMGQKSLPVLVFRETGLTVKKKDQLANFEIREIDPPSDRAAEIEVAVGVATDGNISLTARQLNPDGPLFVERLQS